MDKAFLKTYRTWLLTLNTLSDLGMRRDDMPKPEYLNEWLQYFRNYPKEPSLTVNRPNQRSFDKYRPSKLTYSALKEHLEMRGLATRWMINASSHNVLLMMVDIDAKGEEQDAQQLAEWVAANPLHGRAYIEPSTGGRGRHVYFLVDVAYVSRMKVREVIQDFSKLIQADQHAANFQSHVCRIMGLPTVWRQDDGKWVIEKRGNLLKIPYLPNGEQDFQTLSTLEPVPFNTLESVVYRETKGDNLGVCTTHIALPQKKKRQQEQKLPQTGWQKKLKLCSQMLNKDPSTTDSQLLQSYHDTCNPTGMTPRDIKTRTKEINKIAEDFRRNPVKTIQLHSFKKGQYLEISQRLVPADAFKWNRRDTLNHERLADFLSVKIQDAFYKKDNEYFASASRDATIANFRTLKEKGMVNWIINKNQYAALLKIATQHNLLTIHEEYIRPISFGGAKKIKGVARLIGPGNALSHEAAEWMPLYQAWKKKHTIPQLKIA